MRRDDALTKFVKTLAVHGIKDARVLEAMQRVPREQFVSAKQAAHALADRALPIECGQTISQPYIVAAMTEALEIAPEHKVLEIGTGSGYQAAVLACLAKEVVSVERHPALAESARQRLKGLGIGNVVVIAGDGMEGVPEHAPYDRIMITAAAPAVPPALIAQLAPGGVLVVPIGRADRVQMLSRIRKRTDGMLETEELMTVRFVPLLPDLGGSS